MRRGDLVITVSEAGTLKAVRSVWVKSDIEAHAQILKIIPEGTRVKKGDWLLDLDTTALEQDRDRQLLSVERARSAYEQAKAAYEITLQQNDSDIKAAELARDFARIDLEKFLDPENGDKKVQIQEAQNSITLAKAELENAKTVLENSEKLYAKQYITKNERDRDALNKQKAELNLQLAIARKENLLKFQLPKQEQQLKENLAEAERNLKRVKERCRQKEIQAKTDMDSKKQQLDIEEAQLERIDRQIKAGKIYAPQDGLVVYYNEEGRWRRGSSDPIAEGVTVRYRQKIISLPDVSKMLAQVNIHESARSLLWVGQPATVKVEALEGTVFKGKVSKVPEVPDSSSSWLTPDRKVYKVTISIEGDCSRIRPGMSCRVTIYCERVPDTLYIPIQAVETAGKGLFYVYVKTPEGPKVRVVKPGKHNDKFVQVLSGLEEGELVYLSEPPQAPPPPKPKSSGSGGEIPAGIRVPQGVSPGVAGKDSPVKPSPAAARRGRPGGGRTGRKGPDPARILERLKESRPELYEKLKDLPPGEILKKLRAMRSPGKGGAGRGGKGGWGS